MMTTGLPLREHAETAWNNLEFPQHVHNHYSESIGMVDDIITAYADGRLIDGQAIADAYTAERSNLASIGKPLTRGHVLRQWFPELAALLDALSEEAGDE